MSLVADVKPTVMYYKTYYFSGESSNHYTQKEDPHQFAC